MRPALFLLPLLLSACAVTGKKGILLEVDPGTPVEEQDLRRHCDLGDNAACVLAGHANAKLPQTAYAMVQGIAPADRAVFAAVIPKGKDFLWFVYDTELNHLRRIFTPKPLSRGRSEWAVQRLEMPGLTPGRIYDLLAGDTEGHLLEFRRFHTLSLDVKEPRIELIGGWRLASAQERSMLTMITRNPKNLLVVLDGSAALVRLPDSDSPRSSREAADAFFDLHIAARRLFDPGFERELVPFTNRWNDDEFGHEDGDRSFEFRDRAREIVELFFPKWADDTTIFAGPAETKCLVLGDKELVLADDLSFRKAPTPVEPECVASPRKKPVCHPGKPLPPPTGTRYGGVERDWIADRVAKSKRPLWILAGGPSLHPFREDWVEKSDLDAPSLTHAPRHPWHATIEGMPDGQLHLSPPEALDWPDPLPELSHH